MHLKLLFLQLPRLDNDVAGAREEARLAGVYLRHAVEKSDEARYHRCGYLKDADYHLDDAHLAGKIITARPDIIAATLYLWNIERTLDLLRKVRVALPQVKIIAGGPEVARDHPFLFRSRIIDVAVSGEGGVVLPVVLNALRKKQKPDLSAVGWRQGNKYMSRNFPLLADPPADSNPSRAGFIPATVADVPPKADPHQAEKSALPSKKLPRLAGPLIWGTGKAAEANLADALPPVKYQSNQSDKNQVAYLETTRGCPRACIFCRYGQERRSLSYLSARDVLARIAWLKKKSIRETRFIDPAFNANPCFEEIIKRIAGINRRRKLRFFAELNGDLLTARQIKFLAAAGFEEVEIGVQSCSPEVLSMIRRPSDTGRIAVAITHLLKRGIKVTLDLMYPLPGQSRAEIIRSVKWARGLRGARIQCLQTLGLPGTELRRRAGEWKLRIDNRPPYLVGASSRISAGQLGEIAGSIRRLTGTQADCPTDLFVGADLPDLFEEKHVFTIPEYLNDNLVRKVGTDCQSVRKDGVIRLSRPTIKQQNIHDNIKFIPGSSARRAFIFKGSNLFGFRREIGALIGKAARAEPHILWQFVLAPAEEEPLDMIDFLVKEIRRAPEHINDRWIRMETGGKLAARRMFILLEAKTRYDKLWIQAAENLLRTIFY